MFDKAKMQAEIVDLKDKLRHSKDLSRCLHKKLEHSRKRKANRVAMKPSSDYYVILSPTSAEINNDTEKETPRFKPLFFVNDPSNIHTGTIDYFNDLLHKLFDKESLSKFYKTISKIDKDSDYPVNMLSVVKFDTMKFPKARAKGLIKLSDYNTFEPSPASCMPHSCFPHMMP